MVETNGPGLTSRLFSVCDLEQAAYWLCTLPASSVQWAQYLQLLTMGNNVYY